MKMFLTTCLIYMSFVYQPDELEFRNLKSNPTGCTSKYLNSECNPLFSGSDLLKHKWESEDEVGEQLYRFARGQGRHVLAADGSPLS